jgi:hypothetical protein
MVAIQPHSHFAYTREPLVQRVRASRERTCDGFSNCRTWLIHHLRFRRQGCGACGTVPIQNCCLTANAATVQRLSDRNLHMYQLRNEGIRPALACLKFVIFETFRVLVCPGVVTYLLAWIIVPSELELKAVVAVQPVS